MNYSAIRAIFCNSGQQSQAKLRFYRGVCVLQKLQQSRHGDGRFCFNRGSLHRCCSRFVESFLEPFTQLLAGILLDVRVGVDQQIGTGMNQTFDALPSSYRVGDVSFTLLAATFKNLKKEDFDLEKDLPSAGLVTDDGQITNGGLLLCDQGVLKQSRIFCTRWKGNYKGSIEEDALDDKEFQGASLITLPQNAEDALSYKCDSFLAGSTSPFGHTAASCITL